MPLPVREFDQPPKVRMTTDNSRRARWFGGRTRDWTLRVFSSRWCSTGAQVVMLEVYRIASAGASPSRLSRPRVVKKLGISYVPVRSGELHRPAHAGVIRVAATRALWVWLAAAPRAAAGDFARALIMGGAIAMP